MKQFDSAQQAKVFDILSSEAVSRAEFALVIYSVSLLLFGFTSYPYINLADPSITLWNNLASRLAFNTIPMAALALVLHKIRLSDSLKIYLAFFSHAFFFNIASLIYTWPLILKGKEQLFLHVNGSNIVYLVAFWLIVVPPIKRILIPMLISTFFLLAPTSYVAFKIQDTVIRATIIGDLILFLFASWLSAIFYAKIYTRLATLTVIKQNKASKFLGKQLQAAIFEGKSELLKEEIRSGYIAVIDIRDSTKLTNQYKSQWAEFNKAWFDETTKILSKHDAYILKTVGDCLVITFGVFEEVTDLSDIPGLQRELSDANQHRWQRLTRNCLDGLSAVLKNSIALADRHIPEAKVRFGAGVDRGPVVRGVRGSSERFELDIWGDRVNCAVKLEAYSKTVAKHFAEDSSALVISPFASDFIENTNDFKKFSTDKEPLKDFPGIRWVLAKEFKRIANSAVDTDKAAA